MKIEVKKMVSMGVLVSLSIVLMLLVRFPIIPSAPYLVYEPADVPILIGGFLFGPLAGFIVLVVEAVIQAAFFSNDGIIGLIMHLAASGAFVLTAGLIYKKLHSLKGAIVALVAGTIAMAAVMVPVNLIIQPNFYSVPLDVVKSLLIPAIIPFNLIKAGINSLVTFIVYKSISKIVHKI